MSKQYFGSKAEYLFGFWLGTLVTIILLNAFPGKLISRGRFWFAVGYDVLFLAASIIFSIIAKKQSSQGASF